MKTTEQGAACYVATSPELAGVTGYFFADSNPSYPVGFMEDDEMARKLWAVGVRHQKLNDEKLSGRMKSAGKITSEFISGSQRLAD